MNTHNQKRILLEWMKLHPEVARGRLRRKVTKISNENKQKMLLDIIIIFNNVKCIKYINIQFQKELLEDMANVTANKGPIKSSSEWLKVL